MVTRNNYCFTNNTGVVADALVLEFSVAAELLAVNEKDPTDNAFPSTLMKKKITQKSPFEI